jgi:hypothetical protein
MQIEGRRFGCNSECLTSDLNASLCLPIMSTDDVKHEEADKSILDTPEGITDRQTDTLSNLHLFNRRSSSIGL